MEPTIQAGDWLLVDPTTIRWPRRGSIVAFHEPDGGALSIKRVAAGPGDRVPFEDGYLELADDEAWLLADASDDEAAAAGLGAPIDSRRYGPVPGRAARRAGLVPLRPVAALRSAATHLTIVEWTGIVGCPRLGATNRPSRPKAHQGNTTHMTISTRRLGGAITITLLSLALDRLRRLGPVGRRDRQPDARIDPGARIGRAEHTDRASPSAAAACPAPASRRPAASRSPTRALP